MPGGMSGSMPDLGGLDGYSDLDEPVDAPALRTSYFTFGFGHAHAVGGFTYDKDVLVKITAEDPRAVMHRWFGQTWSMEYPEGQLPLDELLAYCPRGVKVIPG